MLTRQFLEAKTHFPLSTGELRRARHRGGQADEVSGSGLPGVNSRPAPNLANRVSGPARRRQSEPRTETSGSVADILEALRRRADHDIALRLDLEHREAALDQPP